MHLFGHVETCSSAGTSYARGLSDFLLKAILSGSSLCAFYSEVVDDTAGLVAEMDLNRQHPRVCSFRAPKLPFVVV